MDENKDLKTAADTASEDKKASSGKTKEKIKRIKNQYLLKKGGYSIVITAIFLAALIVVNILVGVLAERFVLQYDFSADKKNSLTKSNVKYIKNLKDDVTVTFCTNENDYPAYMSYFAQQYGLSQEDTDVADYYEQTVKLVKKYADYSKKIKLKFVDPQTQEFSKIASEYSEEDISYGDIIVSAKNNGIKRHKVLSFKDIYDVEEDNTYAMYGMQSATILGNNIENALTGAVSYVVSKKDKKVAFITGHTVGDITAEYKKLLKDNNYVIDEISDIVVKDISSDYDAIIIAAPSKDFLPDEITAISEFLDNDGKLGKGLIFFANLSSPYLDNLYDFLSQWGISIDEGVVFEADQSVAIQNATTLMSLNEKQDKFCVTGDNVPITAAFEKRDNMTVTPIMSTLGVEVVAPKGSGDDFSDFGEDDIKSFSTAIQSYMLEYDEDNNEEKSFVTAFSSTYFLDSQFNDEDRIYNKDITLKLTNDSLNVEESDILFVSKSIENPSFLGSVTQGAVSTIQVLFMIVLPLCILAIGIFVFVKRRNA